MIISLTCAAAPECSLSCQRPLTILLFPWQFGRQRPLRRRSSRPRHLHCSGHHHAVRGAQGERRDLARVRRRPECFCFCQRPLTRLLSLTISAPPSSAVSTATTLETRAPLRSPPSSRRRRSPAWGARPHRVFDFVSMPIDTLSIRLRSRARSLQGNRLGPQGGAALAEGIKGNTTLRSLK